MRLQHALGLSLGARGVEYHRDVFRPGDLRCIVLGIKTRDLGKKAGRRAFGVPSAERHAFDPADLVHQGLEPQPLLQQHQLGLHRAENLRDIVAIHLDIGGGDGRAVALHAEEHRHELNGVLRQHHHTVIGRDTAIAEIARHLIAEPTQVAVGEVLILLDGVNVGLVRKACGLCRDNRPHRPELVRFVSHGLKLARAKGPFNQRFQVFRRFRKNSRQGPPIRPRDTDIAPTGKTRYLSKLFGTRTYYLGPKPKTGCGSTWRNRFCAFI